MKNKNKYINRSRISEEKFREIVKLFSLDLQAIQIAKVLGISQPAVSKIIKRM